MPYKVSWYIENEIVYAYYSGKITGDELQNSLLETKAMVESSERHLVHVMSDVGDVTEPVRPLESLAVVRKVGNAPQSGWMLILREKSALIKFGVALGTTVFKSRNRAFDSLDQAEAFLKDMDSTLSWDKVLPIEDMRSA